AVMLVMFDTRYSTTSAFLGLCRLVNGFSRTTDWLLLLPHGTHCVPLLFAASSQPNVALAETL
ncbi:hypothetical protein, partial [Chromobacterium haemolyticum]|uniref:hypothetical protein n=1 Tax=Chromobacterium haemolyticum TaxID=394935 RepID=UPI0019633F3A